mmetsp:Transcript_49929/g.145214  ORF Transcript_49929/g.145214 Transcript_49929/m.145214 type:complete len:224 (+) Transcript_49929:319-990(+)
MVCARSLALFGGLPVPNHTRRVAGGRRFLVRHELVPRWLDALAGLVDDLDERILVHLLPQGEGLATPNDAAGVFRVGLLLQHHLEVQQPFLLQHKAPIARLWVDLALLRVAGPVEGEVVHEVDAFQCLAHRRFGEGPHTVSAHADGVPVARDVPQAATTAVVVRAAERCQSRGTALFSEPEDAPEILWQRRAANKHRDRRGAVGDIPGLRLANGPDRLKTHPL